MTAFHALIYYIYCNLRDIYPGRLRLQTLYSVLRTLGYIYMCVCV